MKKNTISPKWKRFWTLKLLFSLEFEYFEKFFESLYLSPYGLNTTLRKIFVQDFSSWKVQICCFWTIFHSKISHINSYKTKTTLLEIFSAKLHIVKSSQRMCSLKKVFLSLLLARKSDVFLIFFWFFSCWKYVSVPSKCFRLLELWICSFPLSGTMDLFL